MAEKRSFKILILDAMGHFPNLENGGAYTLENRVNSNETIEESNFLTVDWTDYEILMGHSVEPEDSGRGWEFSVADVDFEGTLELLVTFAANHCGQNALYIYKQEGDRVVSYVDTYAVFGEYVTSDIDYKAISSYMDIKESEIQD